MLRFAMSVTTSLHSFVTDFTMITTTIVGLLFLDENPHYLIYYIQKQNGIPTELLLIYRMPSKLETSITYLAQIQSNMI